MEYAHSRGVIHRDLKPGNIMLGPFGETLVVDWGIAKVVGKSQNAPTAKQVDDSVELDPELTALATAISGETQPGTTIGTPSYMSPEQARGALEEIGPASDVYSLGATLYELLSGKFPFADDKPLEIIEKVQTGQFKPPRSILPTIPLALEAICLKAMAQKPESRYESARELALDLEHWLADEPVSAYPETSIQKLSRWLRRHRAWTQAAAVALVGFTLVATAAVFLVERARRREETVRIEAQDNFSLARKTVDEYLTKVSEDTLLKEQNTVDIRKLRRRLLQTALEYYATFVRKRGDDPELRQELASAYYRVAVITEEISSEREALAAFETAAGLWSKLVEESPADPANRFGLAKCYVAAGRLQLSDNPREAKQVLDRALGLLQPLSNDQPGDRDYQLSLADCYMHEGSILARGRQPAAALGSLDKARQTLQKLADRDPSENLYQGKLAEVINLIGTVHVDYQRDFAAGLQTYEEVKKICLSLLERLDPKPVLYQHLLAVSNFNIGVCQFNSDHAREAIAPYEQASGIWTELVRSHPSVILYQETLAKSLRELAQALAKTADRPKAIAPMERSAAIFERLSGDQPEVAAFHHQIAYTWNCLGTLHDEDKQNQLALSPFSKAVAEQRLAVAKSKDVDAYRESLAIYLENLGEQFLDLGAPDQGLPHYEEALNIRRELFAAHRDDPDYAANLAASLLSLGRIERRLGKFVEAARSATDAREILERWQPQNPKAASLPVRLASALDLEANALADQRQADRALGLLDRAQAVLRPELERSYSPSDMVLLRRAYSEVVWNLIRVRKALNRSAGELAQAEAEQARLWSNRPASELVDLAREEATRASVIAYGKPPTDPLVRAVRALDADMIGAHLRLAAGRGFHDVTALEADPAFRAIFSPSQLKAILSP
jgi:serine/threonine-protein kinase